MNVQDKEYNIDRTKVKGSYTKVYGISGSYGYTEKVDGMYSYIQIKNTGAINELFTGYVDTSEGQGLRFQALIDVEEPADYDTNQSYVEYIDQNGNMLYRLTFQQIKDQIDHGVYNRSSYTKSFHNGSYYGQYHFDVSFTIPAGISKVGFKIYCVTVNPSRDPSNSAIYVSRFGLSDLGRSSSGGTNYINNGYNCLNPSSQAGVQSGNGFARITLITTD